MAAKQRELFQRFQVQKFLGKGSYGSVYRIMRLDDKQVYAVKETDVTQMSQQERRDSANEIRLLASVKHPNVIRYYEAFLDGNWLCIIMEYAQAGDLSYYIKKGRERKIPFPEEIVWSYLIQVLRGVAYLHSKRILHRDIKPMNVFIGKGDVVKIGDLGIATFLRNTMERANTQIGTPHYMAPEIWKKHAYTFEADVWSIGCLLYEMLTYRVPFEAKSIGELQSKVVKGMSTPVSGRYSTALKEMCLSMLQLDPAKRPTLQQLLMEPEIQRRMSSVPGAREADQICSIDETVRVLDTIKVPRNLKQLPANLPQAAYDNDGIKAAR